MQDAFGMAGDIATAGAAIAGLILVFIGSIATAFEAYSVDQQDAVKAKYQRRIWFAFAGFTIAVLSTAAALGGKWFCCIWLIEFAFWALLLVFPIVLIAALLTAKDIR